jgi:hypothetical protein
MRENCEQVGRASPPELQLGGLSVPGGWNPEALLEKIGNFAALGVASATVHVTGRTRAEWCDNAERYSSDIISKL